MTRQEAIEILKANYPDKRYELLREAVDTAIKSLENEPKHYDTESWKITTTEEGLEYAPVKHGHWIVPATYPRTAWCSNCNERVANEFYKYCPHCGAIMDE